MAKIKIAEGLTKVENWATGQSLIEQGICRLEELEQAFNSGYLEAYIDGPNGEQIKLIPPSILKKKRPKYNCRNVFFLWPDNIRYYIDAKDFSIRKPKSGRNEKVSIGESHGPIFDADLFFQNNNKALVHVTRSNTVQMVLHRFHYPFDLPEQVLLFKPLDHSEETLGHKRHDEEWFLWQIILNPILFDFDYLKKAGYKKGAIMTLRFKSREIMFHENKRIQDTLSSIKPAKEINLASNNQSQPSHSPTQMQFILSKLKYKNIEWNSVIGDKEIIGIDGKTIIDLKQIYDKTFELYQEYQPINEWSSSTELISYIREEISHLEVIAETEYEYIGFEHNKANYLLPDRSTYIRRHFLPNPTELAEKRYSKVMCEIKYKYRPTPSIYPLNTTGELSPEDMGSFKTINKLRTTCQELSKKTKIYLRYCTQKCVPRDALT